MKKYLLGTALALGFSPALVFAEDPSAAVPTVTTMIDPSGLQSTLVSALSGWVVIALGIALTCFVVFLGWRALRKGAKTGVSG